MEIKTKVCSKCGETKKISKFHKQPRHSDNRASSCKECNRLRMKKYYSYPKNKKRQRRYQEKRYQNLKQEVINAYGGKCACCGETALEFLTIDHINGGGRAHKQSIGRNSYFYPHLKKNNFPQDPPLRVLCMNCNFATSYGRICPHKIKLQSKI